MIRLRGTRQRIPDYFTNEIEKVHHRYHITSFRADLLHLDKLPINVRANREYGYVFSIFSMPTLLPSPMSQF